MKTLTRADLAETAFRAGPLGLSRRDAADFVDETLKTIADALVAGDTVKVSRFGAFTPRRKKARLGRNPKHPDQEVVIPPKVVLVFRASPELKAQVKHGPLAPKEVFP